MANDLLFMRLVSHQNHVFPFPDGDEAAGEPQFADFESVDEVRRYLLEFPDAHPSYPDRVGWEEPGGGSMVLRAGKGSIYVDCEASWEAVLKLYIYLRQRYEDLVIVRTDDGMIFDEDSYRGAFSTV